MNELCWFLLSVAFIGPLAAPAYAMQRYEPTDIKGIYSLFSFSP
jgi:hypothetical protein